MRRPEPECVTTYPIGIVYAGGTISSFATDRGRVGGREVDLIKELQTHRATVRDVLLNGQQFAYLGLSENITLEHWTTIAGAVQRALEKFPSAVLITHGTDSMEQTARYLQRTCISQLRRQKAHIVLTGANHGIDEPLTDAWDNLEFSIQSCTKRVAPGVYIAFHQRLIPADYVVKEPFNGIAMNYIDNRSSDYKRAMAKAKQRARMLISNLKRENTNLPHKRGIIDYPVNLIRRDHSTIRRHVQQRHVDAMLLTLYHSGTANTEEPTASVARLVQEMRAMHGILVFAVTENGEPFDLHAYGTSTDLREAGVVPLYDMLHDVALAKLRLLPDMPKPALINAMLANQVGEIDKRRILPEDIQQLKKLYLR